MKTTGRCPKCDSDAIHVVPGERNEMSIMMDWAGFLTSVPVSRYICIACGYVESYIDSAEDRQRIGRKFKRMAQPSNDEQP